MIYRIDLQHFLTHAIDHFSADDLTHFQYAIISAKIKNGRRRDNVTKINLLYPSNAIVSAHAEYQDKSILEKMFMEEMHPIKGDTGNDSVANTMYTVFVNPLLKHTNVVILCDRIENDYIDVICKYLDKEFGIEVIDLNELFSKGHIGPLYIDRGSIRNKAVDIRRSAAREEVKSLECTRDGKLKLLGLMNKKDKIAKLKKLGINVTDGDKKNLDKLLVDEWVDNDNDD